ncbi:sensor histidine kinase [Herbiconiux sp. L3-i23]|uniref:sensor histidine kinase n=1 Tax=Herbiconiux sp. L3-i23 TaxID=2905871 RepID=UPI00206689F7|nr:sensor histidine kinase [Herbiconiux sp. L3-i23]BDI23244.1 two-component sensor histidine kinase [Herbiconiux sp. L3-i23]
MTEKPVAASGAASASTGAFYRFLAAHPRLVDAVIASAVLFFTGMPYLIVAAVSIVTGSPDAPGELFVLAIELALVVPLFWRRTHPVIAAAVMLVPCLIQLIWDVEIVAGQVAVLIIIAALAGYAPRWASRGGLALALVGILLLAIRTSGFSSQGGHPWIGLVIFTVLGWSLVGVAWLTGDQTRSRRVERAALADRADRIERERDRELKLAAADERAHIAREMHDIVAHSLSIIVTQADGARYAAPPAAGPVLPALEAIAETARTSLSDMRRLLGVFRADEDAPTAPSPRVAEIPALLDAVRASGLAVRFTTSGERNRPELPMGAELVLYRVIQESLTNVLKHAGGGAHAEVDLAWGAREVVVSVSDNGRGMAAEQHDPGHGLHGMRERLALYGGGLAVGESPAGGVSVRASLPYERELGT